MLPSSTETVDDGSSSARLHVPPRHPLGCPCTASLVMCSRRIDAVELMINGLSGVQSPVELCAQVT